MHPDFEKRFPGLALQPVDFAPSMTTFNGSGFRLFGRYGIANESEYYFSVYCFCLFTAPIFPLRIYLVKRRLSLFSFAASTSLKDFCAYFSNGRAFIRSNFLRLRCLLVYAFLTILPAFYIVLKRHEIAEHLRQAYDMPETILPSLKAWLANLRSGPT